MDILGTQLHVRKIPAAIFVLVSLLGLYLGIIAPSGIVPIDDKLQHFLCFFFMGLSLYWVVDISKKRATQLSIVVLLASSILSELIQSYLTIRSFDPADIMANVLGSAFSVALNVTYHGRLLQRKRQAKYSNLELTDLEEQADITLPAGDAEETTDEDHDEVQKQ